MKQTINDSNARRFGECDGPEQSSEMGAGSLDSSPHIEFCAPERGRLYCDGDYLQNLTLKQARERFQLTAFQDTRANRIC